MEHQHGHRFAPFKRSVKGAWHNHIAASINIAVTCSDALNEAAVSKGLSI